MSGRPKIVVLGMLTKIPVAGAIWQNVHYLVGLERLGFETYYVEAHARTPTALMRNGEDDASLLAAEFLDRLLRRFGLQDRWAFHALHEDGRCYGLSETRLRRLYRDADLIVNLHGGTVPLPEHVETGRLVYLETDPVELEIELHDGLPHAVEFAQAHRAFSTWALNYGQSDCLVPHPDGIEWLPAPPPVLLDLWPPASGPGSAFTTVGNWRQYGEVRYGGETYTWSKHHEFLKFLELPQATGQRFELAFGSSSYGEEDRRLLETNGWLVRRAEEVSADLDAYRDYVAGSRGEFTVAKDQNVRLRSGWFSERSAVYLASGRPVITQDTGFGNYLPTGEGLFAFSTLDDALGAVEAINADHARHSRAAREIAREFFDADLVLPRLLAHYSVTIPHRRAAQRLVLEPVSRRPTRLTAETLEAAQELEVAPRAATGDEPVASIVVVTHGSLPFTRLCLHTLLENTESPPLEVIVVDNGSNDGTADFLREAAERDQRVRVIVNDENRGFAAANNQGIALARGDYLVLLNNDTIVPPGWLAALIRHAEDPTVGLVGPVTNRAGNEAQLDLAYRSYGEFLDLAAQRAREHAGEAFEIPVLTMFCVAARRRVVEKVGPLDETFGLGLLEDDDYSRRVREAGFRTLCAEEVLVHHFSEASFGALFATGAWSRIFDENRRHFEKKWGRPWQPHGRRERASYEELKERIRGLVRTTLPSEGVVLVVSRGDGTLLDLDGRQAEHFPQANGAYAGHHPASSEEAIAEIESLHRRGARYLLFPATSLWWLDHYDGLREYLEGHGAVAGAQETCLIYDLEGR